jgi:Ca2+-binding RTX toxin-like protein
MLHLSYHQPSQWEKIMVLPTRRLTSGDDTYHDADTATLIDGLAGDDVIHGNGGNDIIYGGLGSDDLYGGRGNDTIYAQMPGWSGGDDGTGMGDYIEGGDGDDTIHGLAYASIHVRGGNGNDTIRASAEYATVYGDAGDDRIDAGAEAPDVYGGAGNDIIDVGGFVGCLGDGGAGNDTILASASAGLIRARGGAGADAITLGGDGVELQVDGGSGNDLIDARPITRDPDFGSRSVQNLLGGDGDDIIYGAKDVVAGKSWLYGQDGNDRLYGNAGADKLGPGHGIDSMTGGGGRDIFDINTGDSGIGRGRRDVITDFGGDDTIDLVSMDAHLGRAGNQAFSFIGSKAFTAAGQLRFSFDGGRTVIQGSIDGDRAPEFEIELTGRHALGIGDFLL